MLSRKHFPVLIALLVLALGTVACFCFHTESAVKHLISQKEATPLSQIAELQQFPQADHWRVLFRMSQGDWYDRLHGIEKGNREHIAADDRLIEHLFAYMPAGEDFDGLTPFEPLPDSAVINLNRDFELTELPGAKPQHVMAACKACFYPYPEEKNTLRYDVLYFRMKDGTRFIQLSRVPVAQLKAERAGAAR